MTEQPRLYYIQTRTEHGWHRLHPENYWGLTEATHGLERYIDSMFFEHGEMLPTSIFRIVRVKPKKGGVDVHEDTSVGTLAG